MGLNCPGPALRIRCLSNNSSEPAAKNSLADKERSNDSTRSFKAAATRVTGTGEQCLSPYKPCRRARRFALLSTNNSLTVALQPRYNLYFNHRVSVFALLDLFVHRPHSRVWVNRFEQDT